MTEVQQTCVCACARALFLAPTLRMDGEREIYSDSMIQIEGLTYWDGFGRGRMTRCLSAFLPACPFLCHLSLDQSKQFPALTCV